MSIFLVFGQIIKYSFSEKFHIDIRLVSKLILNGKFWIRKKKLDKLGLSYCSSKESPIFVKFSKSMD